MCKYNLCNSKLQLFFFKLPAESSIHIPCKDTQLLPVLNCIVFQTGIVCGWVFWVTCIGSRYAYKYYFSRRIALYESIIDKQNQICHKNELRCISLRGAMYQHNTACSRAFTLTPASTAAQPNCAELIARNKYSEIIWRAIKCLACPSIVAGSRRDARWLDDCQQHKGDISCTPTGRQ